MADTTGLNPATVKLRPIKDALSHDGIRVNGTAKSVTQAGLEDLITGAESYQTVDLIPNGAYDDITSTLDLTGLSPGVIIDGHGATIAAASPLTTSLMTIAQHGVKVINLQVNGAESDGTTWAGNASDEASGLRFEAPSGSDFLESPVCERVELTNCTYGVWAEDCRRGVFDIISNGHLSGNAAIDAHTAQVGAGTRLLNYNAGLHVKGGEDNEVWIKGSNHGQLLLVGSTSKRVTVQRAIGSDLFDNGVYLSSCEDADVRFVHITNCYSSALKLRGSGTIGKVVGEGCLYVCTVSSLTTGDGGRVVIGDVEGTYRDLGFNVDDASDGTGPYYLESVKVGSLYLTRVNTDGAGATLSSSFRTTFPGLYAARVFGGVDETDRRLQEFDLDTLVVDLGDFDDDVDSGDLTTVSGMLLNYCNQPRIGRTIVTATSASNLARGIVAIGCDRPRLYDVRCDTIRKGVQLTDTVGARVTFDLGGASCTEALEETVGSDTAEPMISGDLGTSPVDLWGSSSMLHSETRATGTTETKIGYRVGRNTHFADSVDANQPTTSLPVNRLWKKGDIIHHNSYVSAGGVGGRLCIREGYAYPNGVWSSGTDYDAGDQVRGSDLSVYRAVQASGPGGVGAEDPTSDDGTYWAELGTYAGFASHGIQRLQQGTSLSDASGWADSTAQTDFNNLKAQIEASNLIDS